MSFAKYILLAMCLFIRSSALRMGSRMGMREWDSEGMLLQHVLDSHVTQLSEADIHHVPNAKGIIVKMTDGKEWPQEHFDCQFIANTLISAKGPLLMMGDSQMRLAFEYLTSSIAGQKCLCDVNEDYLKDPKTCKLDDAKQPGNIGYGGVSLNTETDIPLPIYRAADVPGMNITEMRHQDGLGAIVWGQSLHYLHKGYNYKNTHSKVKLDYLKDRQQLARDMRSVYQQAVDNDVPLVVFRTGAPNCIPGERLHFTDPKENEEFLAWCEMKGIPEDNCRDLSATDHGQQALAKIMQSEASTMQQEFKAKKGPLVLFMDIMKLYGSKCQKGQEQAQGHWPFHQALEADVLTHALLIARHSLRMHE